MEAKKVIFPDGWCGQQGSGPKRGPVKLRNGNASIARIQRSWINMFWF